MAWVGPIRDQQFNSATSGTTWTWSPTVTIPVGTLIIVAGCCNDTSIVPNACSDNSVQAGAANTYTSVATINGSTISGAVRFCVTTRSILTSNVITLSAGAATTRRSGKLLTFTGQAAASPLDVFVTKTNTVGTITIGPTAALAGTGELSVGCAFWRGGAVLSGVATSTSGYTLSTASAGSGGVTTRVETNMGYKTTAGTAAESETFTYTSGNAGVGILVTFKPAAGTVFLQTVTGSQGFVGVRPKVAVGRKTLGVVSFSGSRTAAPTGRLVTAAFVPSGSLTRTLTLFRTLVAALSFVGARTAATAYARSVAAASLSFVGTRTSVKAVNKAVAGALSFAGSQTRFPAKMLTAVLQATGATTSVATMFRTFTGAFSSSGTLKRFTSRKLLAAAQYAGSVATSAGANHFFAVFRPTGTTPTHGLPARTLFAGLQLTGSVARFTTRQLVSSLIASGVMTSQYLPPVAAPEPGGGGFGAVMDSAFFARYQVDGKWRGVKRVRA